MLGVLHIIDSDAPAEMLDQLALAASPADRLVSAGPCPDRPLPWPVEELHRPLSAATLCGWRNGGFPGQEKAVHAWSIPAAQVAGAIADQRGCGAVLSLPHVPAPADLARLAKLVRGGELMLTVPTESCRLCLLKALDCPATIHVLPPCARVTGDAAARRKQARASLGLAEHEQLVVAPAGITWQAGHCYACWIHAVLRQIKSNLRLLLPGVGPCVAEVRRFADATGHGEEILMPEEQLAIPDALAAADLAVFFFSREGGLSNLAAAMAAGLPIVAWADDDVSEILGDAGRLTPCGDVRSASAAVLEMLEAPALRASLAASAERRAAGALSVDQCRHKLAEIHQAARRPGCIA
jgi:hypothetical protein